MPDEDDAPAAAPKPARAKSGADQPRKGDRAAGARGAQGRVLAIDSGKVRAGLALSDELRVIASPYRVLDASDRMRLVAEIAAICSAESVTHVLVGLPLHLTGEVGSSARRAVELAQRIADRTQLDVELVDERFTTVEARAIVGRKKRGKGGAPPVIDDAAAAVLLQSWLDGRS